MKNLKFIFIFATTFFFISCASKAPEKLVITPDNSFTFAFMTDVHMNLENNGNGDKGLEMALSNAKSKGVDFVIFGGDNADVDDIDNSQENAADSLITRFKSIVNESGVNAYFTIGNHDRFYRNEGKSDPEGFAKFEKHLAKSYYSFDHKNVHFVVLNSVQRDDNHTYFINEEQFQWLENDLAKAGKEIPIVVVTHVPFQSLYYPAVKGEIINRDMLDNFKEVWDLLQNYNLKIILQGHQHLHEELYVKNTWFLTGGAVSAAWWRGSHYTTEEGYLLIKVDNSKDFSWKYIDYGWETQ